MDENDVAVVVGRVGVERIRTFAARGWVRPARREGRLSFSETDLARVELVCHLTEELELTDEQVPPVLSLIDQLHGVRACMRALLEAIEHEPEDVRVRLSAVLDRPSGDGERS